EAAELWGGGGTPAPKGSAHRLVAPYQAMAAADGYFNLGVANQAVWERFCNAVGRADLLADPRFATNADRTQHYVELATAIEETTLTRPAEHWLKLLDDAGVPAGPIYDMAEVFADPQVLARGMVQELEHPVAGLVKHLGIPVKLSETPGELRMPAPTLGQHTSEIFRRFGIAP
ncbi:MAG: CoA transferase, partial [Dehalococcoidia bacterium]